MDCKLVRQIAPLGNFDGVDFSDQVGHRDVGCREFLCVAFFACDPRDAHVIASLFDFLLALSADGVERVVVELAAFDARNCLIQEADHVPNEAGLGLAALSEKNNVLSGQNSVFQLRNDGLVESDYTREKLLVCADLANQVAPDLLLNWEHYVAGGS